MKRHELFPDLHFSSFTQMRFNIGFTRGIGWKVCPNCRTPTINHAREPFIENKRYRKKPREIDGVVNRKAASVYQTDAVLILVGGVQGRRSDAPTTKQYRVRRCSKACLLRSSPAQPFSAQDFLKPRRSKRRHLPNPA